jgi:hypothetical protein
VVQAAKHRDTTGVSSFLPNVAAIILVVIDSVKRRDVEGRLESWYSYSINATDCVQGPRRGSGLIILFGQDHLYSDQII